MKTCTKENRRMTLEIASRRRALSVNRGIYARRHGPGFLALLAGAGQLRTRYISALGRLECEKGWGSADAHQLAGLAQDITRLGRLRPDIAETCLWHAERLAELVRQHEAVARLEQAHGPRPAWPQRASAVEARPRARQRAGTPRRF